MREKTHEGKYLIRTEEQRLTPVESVEAYKELNDKIASKPWILNLFSDPIVRLRRMV